jgi:epidermal growth factor receptor substrate 15
MAASLSPQERTYYDQLYAIVDKDGAGVLPGHDALPFLVTSGLPQQTLGEIWAVADPDNNGFLTRDGWYKAARLIGWLQKGGQTTVDETLASKRA